MLYEYSDSNQLNGFLHYLFNQGKQSYQDNLIFSASSYFTTSDHRVLTPDHLFNFDSIDDNLYWLGNLQQTEVSLTFCLPNYISALTGFELATINGKYRPKTFSIASSNDNKTFFNSQNYSANFEENLIQYFNYNGSIAKCFKLTCLSSSENTVAIDLDHIEIYGLFQFNRIRIAQTCRNSKFIVFVILS